MAIYYVSPTGSNTAPYDTWAKAANKPSTVISLNPDGWPHTIYVAPGIYVDAISTHNSAWNGLKIVGVAQDGATTPASKKQVVIASASTYSLRLNTGSSGVTLENISFTQTGNTLVFYNQGANNVLNNCWIYDSPGQQLLYSNGQNLIMNRCTLGGSGAQVMSEIASTGSATFNSCIFSNSNKFYAGTYSAFRNTGSGAVAFNNCYLSGTNAGAEGVISNTSTGSIFARCCIISSGLNGYVAKMTNGSITIEDSVLTPNFNIPEFNIFSGAVTSNRNIISAPYFMSNAREGYIFLDVDDLDIPTYDSLNFIANLKPIAVRAGAKINWYIQAANITGNESSVRELIDDGNVVVGCHSYSHSGLNSTGGVFSITSPNSEQINISRASDTIEILGVGVVGGYKSKSLTAIKQELVALGCSVGPSPAGLNEKTLGESLSDSGGAKSSPYTTQLLIDTTAQTGFFYVELVLSRMILESALGLDVKLLATPGGVTSDNVRAAVKAAGYYTCRDSSRVENDLANINLYRTSFASMSEYVGETEAETRRNIGYLASWAGQVGANIALLVHSTNEVSFENISIVLDEVKKFQSVSMESTQFMIDRIRTSGLWTTVDDVNYIRAEFEDLSNYHLLPGSPCIRAGVDVGLTTDADGVAIPTGAGFDIGPYFYKPEVDSGFSPWVKQGSLPALTLSPDCPGKLKQVQEWSKVATAKEIEKNKP